MSNKIVTIWTCDRCEAKVEAEYGAQPTRWAGLTIVHPPRGSRDSDRARTLHLCGECDNDLGSFIDYPRQESDDLSSGGVL